MPEQQLSPAVAIPPQQSPQKSPQRRKVKLGLGVPRAPWNPMPCPAVARMKHKVSERLHMRRSSRQLQKGPLEPFLQHMGLPWGHCSSAMPRLSCPAPPAPVPALCPPSHLSSLLQLFLFSFHSLFSRPSMSLRIIYHAYVSRGKKDPLQPSSPVTDGPSRFAAS